MKQLIRALIEGAMIVLPLAAIVYLVLGIVAKLETAVEPMSGTFVHPGLAAGVILLLACVVAGLLVRSAIGRYVRDAIEASLFERIPGYRLFKAALGGWPASAGNLGGLKPALATIEEGQCPALVMDELGDGRLVVFVPGCPAPMTGALYIFTPDKIVYLDVPLMGFLRAQSSWGLGLKQLVER